MSLATAETPDVLETTVRRLLAHQARVATMAVYLAPSRDTAALREAALLHDIGRLPLLSVTEQPRALTDDERTLLKSHAPVGALLLESVGFSSEVVRIVRHHHERYDGSGAPDGLAGRAIPLGARILAVADAVVAMAEARAYSAPAALTQIRTELLAHRGTQFDPDLADRALQLLDVRAIHRLLAVSSSRDRPL